MDTVLENIEQEVAVKKENAHCHLQIIGNVHPNISQQVELKGEKLDESYFEHGSGTQFEDTMVTSPNIQENDNPHENMASVSLKDITPQVGLAMSHKRRSVVWNHFELTEGGTKAQCQSCSVKIAYANSTSSMKNHLRYKHPAIDTSKRSTRLQPTLNVQKKAMPSGKWQETTRSLVEFCATDLRPLSIVNGVGFKHFVSKLDSSYQIPSHTTIKNYTKYYYEVLKTQLEKDIERQTAVALTTDAWTSCATEGYITVTLHYIDSDWHLHHAVLSTTEINDRHTGEHLAEILREQVRNFNIPKDNISAVTTDNASNIVVCMNILDWVHVRCFGHTLQLGVNAGLSLRPIAKAASHGRCLVGHFLKSPLASIELNKKQKQLNLKEHALLQDVATRWNSTYFMFERLLEQRVAIFSVIHDRRITSATDERRLELSDEVWRIIEEVTPVLKTLQLATTILCSETFPTVSMVYPIVSGLLKNHLAVIDSDSRILIDFKNAVGHDLKKRFKKDGLHRQPYIIAAALDPRYKSLKFMSDQEQNAVWETISNLQCTGSADAPRDSDYPLESDTDEDLQLTSITGTDNSLLTFSSPLEIPTSSSSQPAEKINVGPKPKKMKFEQSNTAMAFLLGDMHDSPSCDSDSQTGKDLELQNYRTEKSATDISPTEWWQKHCNRFPSLALLARKFLAIPGTSVPSERIFSATGNIVTKKRASLDPNTVNQLIFIRENSRDKKRFSSVPIPSTSTMTAIDVPDVYPEATDAFELIDLPPLPNIQPDNE